MFKVIELFSSDDETNESTASAVNSEAKATTLSTKVEPTESSEDTATKTIVEPTVSIENNDTASTSSTAATSQQQEQQRPRHGRRKSVHLLTRTSPEIEFLSNETLKEKETQFGDNKTGKSQGTNVPKKKRANKISILATKPLTSQEIFDSEFEEFLKDEQTTELLRKIAAERVRVNQLLKMNAMPEIKFSLYTEPDRLEFQLMDRFRQREIRQQSTASLK